MAEAGGHSGQQEERYVTSKKSDLSQSPLKQPFLVKLMLGMAMLGMVMLVSENDFTAVPTQNSIVK